MITALKSLPRQSVVFVSIASKDLVLPELGYMFQPKPLLALVELTKEYPHLAFLSPSISNYTLIQNAHQLGSTPSDLLPKDYAFWQDQCEGFLYKSDCLILLPTDNWKSSVGVGEEIALARILRLPIVLDKLRPFYNPDVYAEAQSFISTKQ